MVKLVAVFDNDAKALLPYWNRKLYLDNTASREILGVQYAEDLHKVVGDCAITLITSGTVKINKKS